MEEYNLVQDVGTGLCRGSLKVSSGNAEVFFQGEGETFDEVITSIDLQIEEAGLNELEE